MIDLWAVLALLLLPLTFFVVWPLMRRRSVEAAQRTKPDGEPSPSAQAVLYREHMAELDASRASGAIDEVQYQALQAELARNLLSADGQAFQLSQARQGGRSLLIALALALPVLAVGLYFQWGAYDELELYRDMAASHAGSTDIVAEAKITARLRERTDSNPDDLTSRYVLAQRLMVGNDLAGALEQYRYIVAREPEATGIRAELAQALFFASGSQMTPEVTKQVNLVLASEPSNGTALGLAGIAAFGEGKYRAARDYWKSALAQVPAASTAGQALSSGVARAEQAMRQSGDTEESLASAASPQNDSRGQSEPSVSSAASDNSITIKVSLAESVSASPDTPVFIYARGADSPMPLAIVRLTAAQLPAEVTLDESSAMMPGRSLKTVDRVELIARLAVRGDARPAPGDWQGGIESVSRSQWGELARITIDKEL